MFQNIIKSLEMRIHRVFLTFGFECFSISPSSAQVDVVPTCWVELERKVYRRWKTTPGSDKIGLSIPGAFVSLFFLFSMLGN